MYQLGIDLGSSSVKVALVESTTGKKIHTLHEPQHEMEIISLENGWAEQDPDIWWNNVCTGIKKLIRLTGIDPLKIEAIGIAYQMHGLVIVDHKGNSLRNSIIWCDSRAVDIGNRACKDLGEDLCKLELLNSPGNFTASKLKWVKDNEPELYRKTYKFMLPGDFIAMKFSDKITTTKNGLSEGILWDYKRDQLANSILEYFQIDAALVPDIVDNFSNQGEVTQQAYHETGIKAGTPILYRAGDQANNALSLNVFNPGEVAMTGGTSGVIFAITDSLDSRELVKFNHFAHVNHSGEKAAVGKLLCINGGGIQYSWLKKQFKEASFEDMNDMAMKIPVGSEGVHVFPFGNGSERMFNNKNIGSVINNLNLNKHTRAHLYRAALEGIAFSFVYGMELLEADNLDIKVIRAGNDNLFRSAIFANTITSLIGQKIEIYNITGAVGAARACGLPAGNFKKYGEHVLNNDYVATYEKVKNAEPYFKAYKRWKHELNIILKNK